MKILKVILEHSILGFMFLVLIIAMVLCNLFDVAKVIFAGVILFSFFFGIPIYCGLSSYYNNKKKENNDNK